MFLPISTYLSEELIKWWPRKREGMVKQREEGGEERRVPE